MKIALDVLKGYIALPEDPLEIRDLLDDVGIEVKKDLGDGRFALELLANRGDHHCYGGIATEISGRIGQPVQLPPCHELSIGESPWPVRVESDLCLVYTLTLLHASDAAQPLNPDSTAPLAAADLQSVHAAVDATNLANLELGQPTHAFDADSVDGPIVIRTSHAGEKAWPLFLEEPVELPSGTLVIVDDTKVLAIAGVIGCEESKTTEHTTRMLLESATFDPVAVRKASSALGIHTDSSARFERGADPERPCAGAGRVAHLLINEAGWSVVGTTGQFGSWGNPDRTLALSAAKASSFLAVDLDTQEVISRLERYGFTCAPSTDDEIMVTVPTHRLWDVEHTADLYEELAKSVSYAATPSTLPPIDRGSIPPVEEERLRRVEEVLLGMGFYEVITDGFLSRALSQSLGLPPDHMLNQHVEVTNSIERAYSILRNCPLPQALEAVRVNANWKTSDLKLFEVARVFLPRPLPSPSPDRGELPCDEKDVLWAMAAGLERPASWGREARPADAHFLKGVMEQIGLELAVPLSFGPADDTHPLHPCLHPNRQATLWLDGECVGAWGEVHPGIVERFKIKRARPCYMQIDMEPLLAHGAVRSYAPPPSWHPITRSLAFTLPGQMTAGMLRAHLEACGPTGLQSVRITDVYDYEEQGAPVRAVTFDIVLANPPERSLGAEEVNASLVALAQDIEASFGHLGVKQR